MRWPTVTLGDVFQIARGGSPRPIDEFISDAPDAMPWITIRDATESSKYIYKTRQRIRREGISRSRVVNPGDFLLTNSMSFGRPYISRITGCIHDGWLVLAPTAHEVSHDYLFQLLGSDLVYAQFARLAAGAVVKNLNIELVKGVTIPLPPLPEQRRIADILDKADAVRRKRKEAIALTEELLRSAFLEMFGDPVSNPKGWLLVPMTALGVVTTGNTPSRDVSAYFGSAVEWIKSDNINTSSHYLTRASEGLSETGREVGRTARSGSTLMTCIAGSPQCIGNVALANREVAFNQQINAVTPLPHVDHRFLYVLLLLAKRLVQAASTNGMKGMVSKGKLERVLLFAPPPEQQRAFGRFFDRVLILDGKARDAVAYADALFASLVHRAFRGELTHPSAAGEARKQLALFG